MLALGHGQAGSRFHQLHDEPRGDLAAQPRRRPLALGVEIVGPGDIRDGHGGGGAGPCAPLQQVGGEVCGGGLQFALEDGIDQAQFQGARGAHRFAAEHHLQGRLHADQARQALGAAGAGQQAQVDLRQSQPGIGQGAAVMGRHGHLESAPQGVAVQGGYHRHRLRFDGLDDFGQAGGLRGFAELGDVGAGDESAAAAQQQYRPGPVAPRRVQPLHDARPHPLGQGVDGGVVDTDDRDTLFQLVLDDWLAHIVQSLRLSMTRRALPSERGMLPACWMLTWQDTPM